jgi:hypothetical protein
MSQLRSFLSFWYNFIVGDDWVLTVGVIVALGVAAVAGTQAGWWLLPAIILGTLIVSLRRATGARS